ncbi:MAG: glycosyltransferase family 9 protein [Verrucomicrobia bacterium]|nr:glycosyltransferase family 9 protein [Verrucomicrobiota bacterium]
MKPKLLIFELWGLGDLVIATPFLHSACEKYSVTLVAKPYAQELQARLWPQVRIIPFVAPWTRFQGKYLLWQWPLLEMFRLRKQLANESFDAGISARWDPRDHLLLKLSRAHTRLGFPRLNSQMFLTHSLSKPAAREHRYEYWRVLGRALGLTLPPREAIPLPVARQEAVVLIHTGAGQPVRVWPLERYKSIVAWLRKKNFRVIVTCDADQREWWLRSGEADVATPRSVNELLALVDQASAFIGNDSGPGHLAAFCGVPTFTFFGPQLPEWFSPLHPQGVNLEGKPCPYKPCSDYCRFSVPRCLWNVNEEEAWVHIESFLNRHLRKVNGHTGDLGNLLDAQY